MNLKHQFYKRYYEGIDFRKVDTKDKGVAREEQDRRKRRAEKIEDYNADIFKQQNKALVKYQPSKELLQKLNLGTYELPNYTDIPLTTTYPGLLIGSGTQHETNTKEELKLGFFFDHTTGLPILPGSSIKGVLRSMFPQFGKSLTLPTDITDKQKNKAKFIAAFVPALAALQSEETALLTAVHQLELAVFEGLNIEKTQKDTKGETHRIPMSKRCCFLDAGILSPDPNGKIVGKDALTPHGNNPLRNPVPLPFLKVLPEVVFNFQFLLQDMVLANELIIPKKDLKKLFKNILLTIGVGAKTNVGYGQFTADMSKTLKDKIYADGQAERLEAHITDKHKAQLKFNEFNPEKNEHQATVKAIGEKDYQFALLDDCLLIKTKEATIKKFETAKTKRIKRKPASNFKTLEVGDKVTIRINKQTNPSQLNFTVLPIWMD